MPRLDDLPEKYAWCLALAVVIAGLLLNLGVPFLFLEEPRRVIIAWEMIYNQDFILPTEYGKPYFKKPPVYNWLLAVIGYLTDWSRFALRLPTVFSLLGMGLITWFLGKQYHSNNLGRIAGSLTMVCAGLYFYFSLLAEIDIFYSLIILGALAILFHFEQQEKPWPLFLGYYFLMVLGALTKGFPPTLLFGGLSLLCWLLYRRKLRWLLTWAHLGGIGLALLVLIAYFWPFSMQVSDWERYWAESVGQSTERTLLELPFKELYTHLFSFPLTLWIDILPGGLLLLAGLYRPARKQTFGVPLIAFSTLVLMINLPVYWISPGAKMRYIYMLYPLCILIGTHWYLILANDKRWPDRWLRGLTIFLLIIMGVGALALPFVPQVDVSFGSTVPLVLLAIGFLYLIINKPQLRWPVFIMTLGLARLLFDITALPPRGNSGNGLKDFQQAKAIVEEVGQKDVYLYGYEEQYRISHATVWHIYKLRNKPIQRHIRHKPPPMDAYFIARPENLVEDGIQTGPNLLEWTYGGEDRVLVYIK